MVLRSQSFKSEKAARAFCKKKIDFGYQVVALSTTGTYGSKGYRVTVKYGKKKVVRK